MFDLDSRVGQSAIASSSGGLAHFGRWLPHIWVVLFFIAVAGGWASFSWNKGVERIKQSDTTTTYFTVVMRYKHEREAVALNQKTEWQWLSLFGQIVADQRTVFASTDMKSLYQASFERYFGTVYRVTGDITLGYKLLVFPLNLIFLLGAYALFFHLTRKPALSTALAFLASFPIAIPIAGEFFGMGPVTIYSRRNLFTAFVPFALYLFYLWIQRPRLLIAMFAFIGLISNLHASGILLAEVLIFAYFLYHFKNRGFWRYIPVFGFVVVIFGFVSVGGLWGKVASFFESLTQVVIPNAYAALSDFMSKQGIPGGEDFLFYPLRIYSTLPISLLHIITLLVVMFSCWVLFVERRINPPARAPLLFLAVTAVLSYLWFSEFEYFLWVGVAAFALTWRQPVEWKFELTHYLILATFFVSFIGMLLFQLGFYTINNFPPVINQLRGARFLGLLVFVWLAVLISRIDWKNSGLWRKRLFVICAAVAILMTIRQDFRSYIRYKEDPDSMALLELARWSKEYTPSDATFLVVSTRFGIVAERNVFLHDRESRTTRGQELLPRMWGDFAELKQLAREKGMSYIVIKKDLGELAAVTTPAYDNQRFVLAKNLGELPAGLVPAHENRRFILVKVD